MRQADDLTGQTFGRLVVVQRGPSAAAGRGRTRSQFECLCVCGERIITQSQHLKSGKVLSCGCYRRERIKVLSKEGLQTTTTKRRKALRRRKREAIARSLLQPQQPEIAIEEVQQI
jgi:hypothetical protein